jgi:hypothetical protein
MRVGIELVNSSGCSLDSKVVNLPESEEPEIAIADAIRDCLDEWMLSPGDTIRITEV